MLSTKYKFKQIIIKAIKVILIITVFLIILFYFYTIFFAYKAEKVYLDIIKTNQNIKIQNQLGYYILTPISESKINKELIFYPGGLVNSDAYLYKLGKISEDADIRIFIIKAPFKAAIFDIKSAERIIARYDLKQVIVGGHSLGGIAACRLINNNNDEIIGLLLLGSYCDKDISSFDGKVVSIIGENDNIINKDNYNKSKSNFLLENTKIEKIKGLNHSDFGNYGLQNKDKKSLLTEDQKIEIIKNGISQILSK